MLAILSKLVIGADDRAWIDRIRRDHDPHHALVGPHFTWVFPFGGIPAEDVISHAGAVAAESPVVRFRLSRAMAVRDAFAPRSHIFLIPTDGEHGLRQLHRRLYSGVLAPRLRPDIPFLPHVTVAAFDRHEDAEHLAGSLEPLGIEGQVDAMELVAFDGAAVTELRAFRFGRQ